MYFGIIYFGIFMIIIVLNKLFLVNLSVYLWLILWYYDLNEVKKIML